jgi:hypothetical protein
LKDVGIELPQGESETPDEKRKRIYDRHTIDRNTECLIDTLFGFFESEPSVE